MRGLSQLFVDDLQNGCLKCFIRAVKADDNIRIGIRAILLSAISQRKTAR